MRAAHHHAGLRPARRDELHDAFLASGLDVVVATSGFGMGIDKPDVRCVPHAATPGSLDAYFQQIGRAGRDGEPATIELHHHHDDLRLQRFLVARRPRPDALRAVLDAVADGPVTGAELGERTGLSRQRRTTAVNLLEQVGALRHEDGRIVRANAADLPAGEAVRGCAGGGDGRSGRTPSTPVRHAEWGDGVVLATEADRPTVLFDERGYATLSREAVAENDLLEVREG